MDYSRFINEISAARTPLPLIFTNEKIFEESSELAINLTCGQPNASLVPFKCITITLSDGVKMVIEGDLLTDALQYTCSQGYPKLLAQLIEYQKRLHNPPMQCKWTSTVTSGGQDALCKAFEMVLNIGDYVIAEEYLYPGIVVILKAYKANHLKVKGDKDGIMPDSLRAVLSQWEPEEFRNRKSSVPKIVYINPNGANPVGTSISAARKEEIYKIAQEYNLIIFEDDPYYFLYYGKEKNPSFLSMDVDGRVLRFDSFSKVIACGFRLGYVTGPDVLVQRIILHIQASQMNTSSESQVFVSETLSRWGFNSFISYTDTNANFYKLRRDKFIFYAEKWLSGLAEWNVPSAGFFLWIRVFGLNDTSKLVTEKLRKKHVAFLPGKHCTMDEVDTPYLRASFSRASDVEMDKGLRVLSECIREELSTNNS